MNMRNITELWKALPKSAERDIFKIVAKTEIKKPDAVLDADWLQSPHYQATTDSILEIQDILYREVQSRRAQAGERFQTIQELREKNQPRILNPAKAVMDSFYNPASGVNTPLDPGYYNTANIPVSMTPNEVTAYYSSGGITQNIIDKKTQGLSLNGYTFQCNDLKDEDIEELKEYSESTNFKKAILQESIRDGNLYGGALGIPAFKKDNAMTYGMNLPALIKAGVIEKDCIDYFWEADRWNTVLIPNYIISAKDYINPEEFFIPLAGVSVHRSRVALVRQKILPYWGTIRQMGWGISEMEGWIESVLAYETAIRTIPIMAQQLSLLYMQIPLDAQLMQNGPAYVQQTAEDVASSLRNMSNIFPKVFNTLGEIKSIERHYTDFIPLINFLREDIAAQSDLPVSSLFPINPTGMASDRDSDMELKQASCMKQAANNLPPQLQNIISILAYSCWGPEDPRCQFADRIKLIFESPTVLTTEQITDAGTVFSGMIGAFIQAGMQMGDAVGLAKSFVNESIDIDEKIIQRLTESSILDFEQEGGNNQGPQGALSLVGQQEGTQPTPEGEPKPQGALSLVGSKEQDRTNSGRGVLGMIGKPEPTPNVERVQQSPYTTTVNATTAAPDTSGSDVGSPYGSTNGSGNDTQGGWFNTVTNGVANWFTKVMGNNKEQK